MIYEPIQPILTEEQYQLYVANADYYRRQPAPFAEYVGLCARWNREYSRAWNSYFNGDWRGLCVVGELEELLCV